MVSRPDARTRSGAAAAALALAIVVGVACAAERPFVWVHDLPLLAADQPVIAARDTIVVDVRNQATLSGEFVVGDAGVYRHPTLGTIHVEGRTAAAVASDIQERLKDLLVKPEVTVSIIKTAPVRVNVVGEVRTPGSYELVRGRTVVAALAAAGWLTEFANRDRIFVIRIDQTEQRIRFRARELTAAEPHAARFRLRDGDIIVVE